MGFFKDDLKKVRAFIFDVDGVLSLQTQNITPEGELMRTACTKDGYAIMYSIRKGYIVAVISGGGAPGVRERLEKLGIKPEDIYLKVPNKLEALAEAEQTGSPCRNPGTLCVGKGRNPLHGGRYSGLQRYERGGSACVPGRRL